jgi:galactosyl transferase GMA12/MNN10 family
LYTPEYARLGKHTSRVLCAYAGQRGYDAIVATGILDATRPPAWSKLLLVERYLAANPACTWLMWIDADAVIANPEKRLEDLVDESIDFLAAEDQSACVINSGVFLVRNCSAALDMLRRAYAKVQYIHHPWWEQLALAEALRECGDTLRSRVVRRRLLNAFPDEYREGDFIVHYAGCALEAKLTGVKKILADTAKRGQ